MLMMPVPWHLLIERLPAGGRDAYSQSLLSHADGARSCCIIEALPCEARTAPSR